MKIAAPLHLLSVCVLLLSGAYAGAQQVTMPKPGDPLRKTLFNAMRPTFERELKQKVIFQVDQIRVYQGWAFLSGEPRRPDQGPLVYKRTAYGDAVRADLFSYDYNALLHKSGGRWKLVTYSIGATDVVYADWWKRFHAPKAVMPFSE